MKRKRTIDPHLEESALEQIDSSLIRRSYANLTVGEQHRILEAIDHARIYGARISAVCELLGISPRSPERWRTRRREVLDALTGVMARIQPPRKGKT